MVVPVVVVPVVVECELVGVAVVVETDDVEGPKFIAGQEAWQLPHIKLQTS